MIHAPRVDWRRRLHAAKAFVCSCIVLALSNSGLAQTIAPQRAYPDIWHWLPSTIPAEWAHVSLRRMSTGDVLIEYMDSSRPGNGRHETAAFFSGRRFKNVEEAFHGAYPPPEGVSRTRLSNGQTVMLIAEGIDCDRGLSSKIIVEDAAGKELQRKTLVLLLDRPTRNPQVTCEGEKQPGFRSPIVIARPSSVLPLTDNTFLVADRKVGAVLRFDGELSTRSELLGTRMFLFEPKELRDLATKYPKSVGYGIDWPRFFEDLHAQLSRRVDRPVEPNYTVERDARKSGARPSP